MATSILITFLVVLVTLLGSSCNVKADNILYARERLTRNSYLNWGNYFLRMQSDCNLVLYDAGTPVWASNTAGRARDCYCTMELAGNLVIYTPAGVSIWRTTAPRLTHRNYVFILQKDRNLAIYGPGVWDARSNVRGVGDYAMDTTNTTTNADAVAYAMDVIIDTTNTTSSTTNADAVP